MPSPDSKSVPCETYSIPEAGRILGYSPDVTYQAVRAGKLATIDLLGHGRARRITRATIDRLLNPSKIP
jgi:hypothetical protein